MLEFELHIWAFLVAYFCIHVEYIHIIWTIVHSLQLQLPSLATNQSRVHLHLRWRCTEQSIVIWCTSATTRVCVRNIWVFRMALMARTEPHTLWRRITHFPSPTFALHMQLLYFVCGMWWRIHTIRTTHVLHSLQELQLWCSHLHNAGRCLCLSPAECHVVSLRYCYISVAALSPYMFRFEMLLLITIQSSLRIHHLPLHLLRHYRILQVSNLMSNLPTL